MWKLGLFLGGNLKRKGEGGIKYARLGWLKFRRKKKVGSLRGKLNNMKGLNNRR